MFPSRLAAQKIATARIEMQQNFVVKLRRTRTISRAFSNTTTSSSCRAGLIRFSMIKADLIIEN
jgi:hypothetical protein